MFRRSRLQQFVEEITATEIVTIEGTDVDNVTSCGPARTSSKINNGFQSTSIVQSLATNDMFLTRSSTNSFQLHEASKQRQDPVEDSTNLREVTMHGMDMENDPRGL